MGAPRVSTAGTHRLTLRSRDVAGVATTVTVRGELTPLDRTRLAEVLVDPLLQTGAWDEPVGPDQLDIGLIPGVTDTAADQVRHAASLLGIALDAASVGRTVTVGADVDDDEIRRRWSNAVIERWRVGAAVEPGFASRHADGDSVRDVALPADDAGLISLGHQRGLALDLAELHVIRDHFAGVGRPPTDAELETLAQTWSEHCAHKSFRAAISVTEADGTVGAVDPLMAQLRASTTAIAAPFVVSAFDGNAGIVDFGDGNTYALKCETHNHPSAIEPFGGANTGVGGVIRDILGAHHRPIACTDVLCFGPVDIEDGEVPRGVLHPSRVRDGVVAGVADYGNKIGLPTVAGAVLHHPAFVSNPLVFAGCIGSAPADRPHLTGPHPGDRIILLGGRTGRDGIRGATFSSQEMDATTGDVAGASVQIGDPVVEKLLVEMLGDAWHLYTAITDCGAGGLSSAVGELAERTGAVVDLAHVPLKYGGLASWEIWLSEAQERKVLAVDPARIIELTAVAELHGVEMSDLGSFTGEGRLVVRHATDAIVDLDVEFLHRGRPARHLVAVLPQPVRVRTALVCTDTAAALLALLSHPDIASKATIVRTFDHEVLGSTVVRPLVGARDDGPADGVVIATTAGGDGVGTGPVPAGIAIGIGVNPRYGILDPERMAWAVVDEAIRNVVAAGGDPSAVALMDNFSWGSPARPTTFGDLVVAVQGCCDAAHAYRAPFVSGKDSLNNEFVAAGGARSAIPPTLVITAVAPVRDVGRAVTPDLKRVGNALVLLGTTVAEFGGSHLAEVLGDATPAAVPAPDRAAPDRYWCVHEAIQHGLLASAHDCSEGGLAVAIAEMAIGGRLGVEIATDAVDPDPTVALFSESAGRIVCEIDPAHLAEAKQLFGVHCTLVGHVVADETMTVTGQFRLTIDELAAAFGATT